jgi:hypothetical protein
VIQTSKKSDVLNNIFITNSIDDDNYEKIREYYENCDLYINSKFNEPSVDDTSIEVVSSLTSGVREALYSIEKEIKEKGKTSQYVSMTQFNNFKLKAVAWCNGVFKNILSMDMRNKDIVVFIDSRVSKLEYRFIKILRDLGIKFILIVDDVDNIEIDEDCVLDFKAETTRLNYKGEDSIKDGSSKSTLSTSFTSISELEEALYIKKEVIKVVVSGVEEIKATKNFYGRFNIMADKESEFYIATSGFKMPKPLDLYEIPRLACKNADYMADVCTRYIKAVNDSVKTELTCIIKEKAKEVKGDAGDKFYNTLVRTIATLNDVLSKDRRKIVYYGRPSEFDKYLLSLLAEVSIISVIVLVSNKQDVPLISGVPILELENSAEYFEMPKIDTRDNIQTQAYQASGMVESIFGDTLGMYKYGCITDINSNVFKTTLDETDIWWNREMFLRPGFVKEGKHAELSTMFKVIKGAVGTKLDYEYYVSKFACGKSLTFNSLECFKDNMCSGDRVKVLRGTDVNGIEYSKRLPFIKDGKVRRDIIRQSKNYYYSMLSNEKQDVILDAIDKVLEGSKIKKEYIRDTDVYYDLVLNAALNMNELVLQIIQWFEFYTENPNIILLIPKASNMELSEMVMLTLLHELGFDILIFVPTCYNTIENMVAEEFNYDSHFLGEARYDIDIEVITVKEGMRIDEKSKAVKKISNFMSRVLGIN